MAKKNAGKQNEKAKTRKGASKLRRTVMGTLSGIFLISALIVAAIPVKETEAEELLTEADIVDSFTTAYKANPNIPDYSGAPVFFDETGMFGIARVFNGEWTGVLVYYNSDSTKHSDTVTIPDDQVVYQYKRVNEVSTELDVLCAVSGDQEFLYYNINEGLKDVSGNDIGDLPENMELKICDLAHIDDWKDKKLYNESKETRTQLRLNVQYIGDIRYELKDIEETNGKIEGYYSEAGKGVFEGITNFDNLVVPSYILAIGDNAFIQCQVKELELSTSIHSIGNHAFDGCNVLKKVTFSSPSGSGNVGSSGLEEIGDFAFANCRDLQSINIPGQVQRIGSGCFMNCTSLSSTNLDGGNNGNTLLTKLGDGVFYGCTSLEEMALPLGLDNITEWDYMFYRCINLKYLGLPNNTVSGTFNHTNVTGCYNLYHVSAINQNIQFECSGCGPLHDDDVQYKDGKGDSCTFGINNLGAFYPGDPGTYKVSEKFYIEVLAHNMDYLGYKYATEHKYAVKYGGTYEKSQGNFYYCAQSIVENEENSTAGKLTSLGISPLNTSASPKYVFIPDQIGPMEILSIEQAFREFNQKEEIEYVHIPRLVQTIGEEAFVDCKKLSEVEFANASNITKITDGAFKTNADSKEVKLRFVGVISSESAESVPYQYAMNYKNNYNSTSSPIGYISYTSQFPYNLEVELIVERDPYDNTKVLSSVPTLVRIPTEKQLMGEDGLNYSLSTYDTQRDEQNKIVARTANDIRAGVLYREMAEDEQQVYNAVYNVVLPEGIYAIKAAEKDSEGNYIEKGVFQDKAYLESAVFNSVVEVPDEAFIGCTNLSLFRMYSSGVAGGERLGDRVFEKDQKLSVVLLPNTLSEIGSIPFHLCTNLHSDSVDFSGSPKFSCVNAIIYENKEDNTKKIVEGLYLRGTGEDCGANTIESEEFVNVTELAPYAFQDCPYIGTVDMRDADINTIPEYCFENCKKLTTCYVSANTRTIGDCAFQKTVMGGIQIPAGVNLISDSAFLEIEEIDVAHSHDDDIKGMTIKCEQGTVAYDYAVKHGFIIGEIPHTYRVTFYGHDLKELDTQMVEEGQAAKAPEPPKVDGMVFIEWRGGDFSAVYDNLNIYAVYWPESSLSDNTIYHTVTFWNEDKTQALSVQKVPHGGSATAPSVNPEKDGYTFTGWLPEFTNVTTDLDVYPQFRQGVYNSNDPNGNGGSNNPNGGNGSGNGSGNDSNGGNGNGNGTGNGSNGSGSGGSGSGGSGSSVSGNGTYRPNSSNRGNTTKVDVNKTGLSNTGLITATVNGSTDDFVVKITDSESARNAVEQALLNEYGSLDNIRYFAMDISLYDRTGTTKIQNTDGITVTITMPIPDALRSYGGNNKAGAVVGNNNLQKLDAKFTTIDGVPCISFVATHFSPYTIYVDLNNLSASGMIDATPTTGDPIHPKWFLSIGLLLMSIMMFCMKGSKRTVVKVISG